VVVLAIVVSLSVPAESKLPRCAAGDGGTGEAVQARAAAVPTGTHRTIRPISDKML
jgi:hypothetical protein